MQGFSISSSGLGMRRVLPVVHQLLVVVVSQELGLEEDPFSVKVLSLKSATVGVVVTTFTIVVPDSREEGIVT